MISSISNIINNILFDIRLYRTLVIEGHLLRVKFIIIIYLISSILRFFYKLIGKDYSRFYVSNVTIKNKYGIYFCGKSFNSSKIVSSFYEKELENYFDLTKGVFIDVGAHIGKYAIRLAKKMLNQGKVIAIEPEDKNFNLLSKNVKLNGLNNITMLNVACSNIDGQISFYVDKNASTLHTIYANDPNKAKSKILINSNRLDTIILRHNIRRVDLIKIDVEGAEFDVLKGATHLIKDYSPKIIVEICNNKSMERIRRFLYNLNYGVTHIYQKNYLAYREK